jgi:hypothetical protein
MDFDGLVAKTGSGGTAGTGGFGGQGGASGAAGSNDGGGGTDGGGAAGSGGAAGNAGASGTGGKAVDGGKDGTAVDGGKSDVAGDGPRGDGAVDGGKGGDAATDRRSDTIADVRSDTAFDCAAVSGTVYQGHCYYLSPTPTTWDVASTTSCAAPSHLAVITTAGEQNVVAAIFAQNDRWIGLRKDPGPPNQESRFYWVTKEAVAFKIWDSYDAGTPEPNYTGDCVRMRATNNWGDTPCTEMYAAVCEYE